MASTDYALWRVSRKMAQMADMLEPMEPNEAHNVLVNVTAALISSQTDSQRVLENYVKHLRDLTKALGDGYGKGISNGN